MRMRGIVLAMALTAATGCGLFEPQAVELTPEQISQLEHQLGALDKHNRSAWEAAIAQQLGVLLTAVDKVEATARGVRVTLQPPAGEAGEVAGTTLIERVASNPTGAGALAALPLAVFAGLGVLARRARLRAQGGKS